jgi:hypothetical protein
MATKKQEMHVRLNFADKKELQELALSEDITLSQYVRRIIRNHLREHRLKQAVPVLQQKSPSGMATRPKRKKRSKKRTRRKPQLRITFGR